MLDDLDLRATNAMLLRRVQKLEALLAIHVPTPPPNAIDAYNAITAYLHQGKLDTKFTVWLYPYVLGMSEPEFVSLMQWTSDPHPWRPFLRLVVDLGAVDKSLERAAAERHLLEIAQSLLTLQHMSIVTPEELLARFDPAIVPGLMVPREARLD